MSRPGLASYLLAYGAGLGCAPYLELEPRSVLLPLLFALLWLFLRERSWSWPVLLAFFCTLGISAYHLRADPPQDPSHVRTFVTERKVTLQGTVRTVSPRQGGRTVIDLEAERVASGGIAALVRGPVRLYVGEGVCDVNAGDTIRFLSRLRAPRLFGTPGEFDFRLHLAARDIFVTAFLPNARGIATIASPPSPGPAGRVQRWRNDIGRLIDQSVGPSRAPLVRALVIGDKGGLPPEQRDVLARGGVSHLFSISGLHLGLVALLLYWACLAFYRRSEPLLLLAPPRRALPFLLMPLLLAYVALTGAALPTRRAFLMALIAALLLLMARRTAPWRLLAAAAFLILAAEPLALFEPSFQLSFAGVFGIMVLLGRWRPHLDVLPRLFRRTATLFLVTLAATVATTPFVILHFHMLAPAGLLANLAAVPGIGFVAVPLGLCGAILSPLWPAAAGVLFRGCAAITGAVLDLVDWMVRIPALAGWRLYLSPTELAGLFLLAGAWLLPAGSCRRRRARGLLLAASLALLLFPFPAPRGLAVTALSVGQGDAVILSRGDGSHYLIDGGGLYSDTFDVGERLVAPALGRLGIDSLSAVVLTHDHPDHRKGLVYVLEHFAVGAFWSPAPLEELHPSLQEVLLRRGISVVTFPPGWTILEETEEAAFALFAPSGEGEWNSNDSSLVLYARREKDAVLLTGDLEANGVEEFLAASPQWPANLLKLPHHGSRRASPELLLDRFLPELAFVSAGAGNPYRLPHDSVVTELQRRSIPLLRTDLQGSLRFLSGGEGWRVRRWQRGLFR